MCYFVAGFNNKFINDVKVDIGFLLNASGTSSSAIETLANSGLTIRRETIQRQKHQLAKTHQQTVEDYIVENVIPLFSRPSNQPLFYSIFNYVFFVFLYFFIIIEKLFIRP
jgi:hypothetical protein